MSEESYQKLAKVLDTLPNGFPPTENGVELKLLKRIFAPDEADLFCELRLDFETPEQIAERTGRPLEGLEQKLMTMRNKGQIFSVDFGEVKVFKMLPWAFGIFEMQLPHIDREMAEMTEAYMPVFGSQFFSQTPQLMQTLPIEEEISATQEPLPYEKVSQLVESSESFMVMDCICKKEQGLLDNRCDKPLEVCMAFAPVPNIFDDNHMGGRAISKEEAKAVLKKAEDAGLVHFTNNFQNGRFFICNCCGCCCGVLKGINQYGIPASSVANSHYYALIDPDECSLCGTCADERCQVNAIEEGDDANEVIPEKCIGCGLCVTTCPSEAISMVHRTEEDSVAPPADEASWFKERGERRGVDFSQYE